MLKKEGYTMSGKKNNYGFYGSGFSGYSHYKQSFDRNRNISSAPTRSAFDNASENKMRSESSNEKPSILVYIIFYTLLAVGALVFIYVIIQTILEMYFWIAFIPTNANKELQVFFYGITHRLDCLSWGCVPEPYSRWTIYLSCHKKINSCWLGLSVCT